MRTANPALNGNTFSQTSYVYQDDDKMSIQGTVNKTTLLLFITMLAAAFTWYVTRIDSSATQVIMVLGGILGFIMGLITCIKPAWSPTTAPIYCLFEGLFLGGFSAFIDAAYPGIPLLAVSLTFGILFSLLMAYKSGWIKATENFKLGVTAATGGICLVYLFSFILSLFSTEIPFIHGSGLIGIIFSLFVVGIASLNLVLDFDFIEQGAEGGAPRHMEWYAAFGLMVTLIWLYIEIVRLLIKLRSRD